MTDMLAAASRAAVTALILVAVAFPARAADRVALVIGNSAYRHTAGLPNPKNDAEAMGAALKRLGFDVDVRTDLTRAETEQALRQFGDRLDGAKAAVFYYAGHGLQVHGTNYIVPVDAKLTKERDLNFEVVELGTVLNQMEAARRVNLVFLDACRDNPLAETLARSMRATGRSMSVGRGLGRIDAATGTLISYATKDGSVAEDGKGAHSPYTSALLSEIDKPGVEVSVMLRRVREAVMRSTGEKQVPWEYGSLLGEFYFAGQGTSATAVPAPAPSTGPDAGSIELAFWQSVERDGTKQAYEVYLNRYGEKGLFTPLAKGRIARLTTPGGLTDTPATPPLGASTLPPPRVTPEPAPMRPDREARHTPPGPPMARFSHPKNLDPRGDNWVALRSEPSLTQGFRLMKLGPDALFTVIGRQGVWVNVRLRTGEMGWVHSNFVGCCRAAPAY